MGVCCCCPDVVDTTASSGGSRRPYDGRGGRTSPQYQPPQPVSRYCDICGIYIDPSLRDGHRETCRANQRRQMLRQQQQREGGARVSGATEAAGAYNTTICLGSQKDEEETCVVCLEAPRCFAFLPCGHIACCFECAKRLDQCPLCRQSREGLCYVANNILAQYLCKHCKLFIAPTLFEGHREVCALRQRQLMAHSPVVMAVPSPATESTSLAPLVQSSVEGDEQQHTSPQAAAAMTIVIEGVELTLAGATPANGNDDQTPDHDTNRQIHNTPLAGLHCAECLKATERFVLLLPCGHRVLCNECAKKRTTCPVCLSDITNILAVY